MNNRWIIVSVSEPKERWVYEVVSVGRRQFVTSCQKEKQPHEVVALLLEANVAALLSAHLPDNRPKTAVISRNRLFLNNRTHTLFFSLVSLLFEKFFDEFLSLHKPSSCAKFFSDLHELLDERTKASCQARWADDESPRFYKSATETRCFRLTPLFSPRDFTKSYQTINEIEWNETKI